MPYKLIPYLVLAGGAALLILVIFNWGGDYERDKVEKENRDAIEKSTDVRSRAAECLDAGRVWDFRANKCAGAESSLWDRLTGGTR